MNWVTTKCDATRRPASEDPIPGTKVYTLIYNITQATTSQLHGIYPTDCFWYAVLLSIGIHLQPSAIVNLCLHSVIYALEVPGFASSMTCDIPSDHLDPP